MFDLPPPDPGIEFVVASRGMSKGIAQTDGPQALILAREVHPLMWVVTVAFLIFFGQAVLGQAISA